MPPRCVDGATQQCVLAEHVLRLRLQGVGCGVWNVRCEVQRGVRVAWVVASSVRACVCVCACVRVRACACGWLVPQICEDHIPCMSYKPSIPYLYAECKLLYGWEIIRTSIKINGWKGLSTCKHIGDTTGYAPPLHDNVVLLEFHDENVLTCTGRPLKSIVTPLSMCRGFAACKLQNV
eukprot:346090-Chlamydomonas_euryale.AAC.2